MRKAVVMVALLTLAVVVKAADISDRMSLIDAIEFVRAQGIEIAYSSQLVEPSMRVRIIVLDQDPMAALREVLAIHGLELKERTEGNWLVVKDVAKRQGSVVNAGGDRREVQPLPPVMPSLEEVKIVASRHSLFDRRAVSEQFLSGDDIRQMPHIADDAFRAFHRVPGAAANDFSAPLHLRGGTIKEVKVVLDGLELFEPFHMRTLFSPLSIIDPGIIAQAQIFSGGFTADHGNHMSGVIDIASNLSETRPVHEIGVSFINSFVRSKGEFASGRGTYQFSSRRGYLDLLADTTEDEGEQLIPRYSDTFAKVSYVVSDSVDVAGQVLLASDDVRFVDTAEGRNIDDHNSLDYGWVEVNIEPSDRFNLRNLLFTGRVSNLESGTSINQPIEDVSRSYARDVEISGLRSDLNLHVSDSQMWKLGASYRRVKADYDYSIDSLRHTAIDTFSLQSHLQRDIVTTRDGDEIGAFVAYRFQPSDRIVWELGLRWDRQTYLDTEERPQLSPRLSSLFRLSDRTEVRLGWGQYYQPQGIQNLQVEDGVLNYFSAERAEHYVAGIRHRFESGMELRADLYTKYYSNIRPRFENALDVFEYAPESTFDRVHIQPEGGKSLGAEFTLRNRQQTGLDWWLNYTWSRAEDEIGGVAVARSWDQRHAFTANVRWQGERWSLSAIARYHSGWPRNDLRVTPLFNDAGDVIDIETDFSRRNGRRYNDYTRVDVRASRRVRLRRSEFSFYFELFNVFNTTNECCVIGPYLSTGSSASASPVLDDYLQFFPSFGFVWAFGPGVRDTST